MELEALRPQGVKITLDNLRKYRRAVFPACVSESPSLPLPPSSSRFNPQHRQPETQSTTFGVPFLSLDRHAEWVSVNALKLFEPLYLDVDIGDVVNVNDNTVTGAEADAEEDKENLAGDEDKENLDPNLAMSKAPQASGSDWKKALLERQKKRRDERNRRVFDALYRHNSSSSSGSNNRLGGEWKRWSGRDLLVVCAYRDFILPREMTFHPFFALDNANTWVKEEPFAMFEEWTQNAEVGQPAQPQPRAAYGGTSTSAATETWNFTSENDELYPAPSGDQAAARPAAAVGGDLGLKRKRGQEQEQDSALASLQQQQQSESREKKKQKLDTSTLTLRRRKFSNEEEEAVQDVFDRFCRLYGYMV